MSEPHELEGKDKPDEQDERNNFMGTPTRAIFIFKSFMSKYQLHESSFMSGFHVKPYDLIYINNFMISVK